MRVPTDRLPGSPSLGMANAAVRAAAQARDPIALARQQESGGPIATAIAGDGLIDGAVRRSLLRSPRTRRRPLRPLLRAVGRPHRPSVRPSLAAALAPYRITSAKYNGPHVM